MLHFKGKDGLRHTVNPRYVIAISERANGGGSYICWADYSGDMDGHEGCFETAGAIVLEPSYGVLVEQYQESKRKS